MIIISQDRKMIINFDNISGIVIRNNTQENIWQLQCKAFEENKRILGKYKTEERAKEVLDEFISFYRSADKPEDMYAADDAMAQIMTRDKAAFWMPEE